MLVPVRSKVAEALESKYNNNEYAMQVFKIKIIEINRKRVNNREKIINSIEKLIN